MARLPRPSGVCRLVFVAAGLVGGSVANVGCFAYTAAGDRIFAATGILPQIAPSDQIYAWGWTLPLSGEADGTRSRMTNIGAFFDKTLTERLSLYSQGSWLRIDRVGTESLLRVRKFRERLQVFGDQRSGPRVSADARRQSRMGRHRNQPGSPPRRARRSRGSISARVWAISTSAICGRSRCPDLSAIWSADAQPRPDLIRAGFAVQYSIPYLQSKVQSFDLPPLVRGLTPMTEILFTTPAGRSYGARTTALIAPGASYAGEGWEFLIEALVPATRATGDGAGVRAQLNLALDYLFPNTIGRPLFAPR